MATLPTGRGAWRVVETEPLLERLDDWYSAQGIAPKPFQSSAAESDWELHNLTVDPEERHNRAFADPASMSRMRSVLESERDTKRRIPMLRNATN